MSCGIYIIKNLINQKVYIGQSVNIEERWIKHCAGYGIMHNSAIDAAIKKYGKNNFSLEILELCNREELNNKEAYYANLYNSYAPNGYNINICGEAFHNPKHDKEISCYDISTGILIKTFTCTHEADRQGYLRQSIVATADQKGYSKTAYNMLWQWGHEQRIPIIKPQAGKHGGKLVYRYNKDTGEFIDSFKSLVDAERYLNKPGGNKNISSVCNGKRKYAYNYRWSYSLYNNILEEQNK